MFDCIKGYIYWRRVVWFSARKAWGFACGRAQWDIDLTRFESYEIFKRNLKTRNKIPQNEFLCDFSLRESKLINGCLVILFPEAIQLIVHNLNS